METHRHTLLVERETHRSRRDVLPIEPEVEEPKTLVTVCTSEQVRNHVDGPSWGSLCRQTDNVDTIQEWENVGREDLIDEHAGECGPEYLHALGVTVDVEVEGLEDRHGRKVTPVDHL